MTGLDPSLHDTANDHASPSREVRLDLAPVSSHAAPGSERSPAYAIPTVPHTPAAKRGSGRIPSPTAPSGSVPRRLRQPLGSASAARQRWPRPGRGSQPQARGQPQAIASSTCRLAPWLGFSSKPGHEHALAGPRHSSIGPLNAAAMPSSCRINVLGNGPLLAGGRIPAGTPCEGNGGDRNGIRRAGPPRSPCPRPASRTRPK